VKLKITDDTEPGPNGTYAHIGSRGGTEMMAERISKVLAPHLVDQFNLIHSRVRPEMIDSTKQNILVLHDTWDDPEAAHLADPASRARFSKFVFVSNHQLNTFNLAHGVPYSDSFVIRNAIDPIELSEEWIEKDVDNTIRIIYHTTPHRGLEILVPVFEKLCEYHSNIHLDVYSSFAIYGWNHRDEAYKSLFERIKNHPNMTYHGFQSNDVVREALKRAHIYAYPCIWPETSCISVIEAMSAGCQIVTSNLAALPETCASFAEMYQFDEDVNRHANTFANELNRAIHGYRNNSILRGKLRFQKVYYDNFYSWKLRSAEWNSFLNSLYRPTS
jgi:glycosyltransferase involved in cell wall biosynthesis